MRPLDPLFFLLRQAACLLLLTPPMALAQGLASAPDAANPDAPGAPLIHPEMPPFKQGDDAPAPNAWREANDAVARIGGWRVYAREAQQPEATPSGQAAPAAPMAGSAGKDAPAAMPMPSDHHRHQSPRGPQ